MKLTLIDNHLSIFPFSFISSLFLSTALCRVDEKHHFTCDHYIDMPFEIHLISLLFSCAKSFCERFSCSLQINIFKSSGILLSNISSSSSITSSIHFNFFPLTYFSNVNSTRLFQANICLRLSFFLHSRYILDGIIYSC